MTKTQSTKIQARATVTGIGSWMPSTGPQWENPKVYFTIDGREYAWRASGEWLTKGLYRGVVVDLVGYTTDGADLKRVKWTVAQ